MHYNKPIGFIIGDVAAAVARAPAVTAIAQYASARIMNAHGAAHGALAPLAAAALFAMAAPANGAAGLLVGGGPRLNLGSRRRRLYIYGAALHGAVAHRVAQRMAHRTSVLLKGRV